MPIVTPAWPSAEAWPVRVSRVPHNGDTVGAGAAWALNESARARPARARAVATATKTLVIRRVRLRTQRARNACGVLLNFWLRIMTLSFLAFTSYSLRELITTLRVFRGGHQRRIP